MRSAVRMLKTLWAAGISSPGCLSGRGILDILAGQSGFSGVSVTGGR